MPPSAPPPASRKIDPGLIVAVVVGCVIGAVVVYRAATTAPPKARAGLAAALPNSVTIEDRPQLKLATTGEAWAVAFGPDGKSLYTGDRSGITVWDPENGKSLRTLDTKGDGARSLALSGSGAYAVMAVAYGDAVRVVPTGAGAGSGTVLRDAGKMPQAVAVAADDSAVAAAGTDGKARIWDGVGALAPPEPGRVYDTTQAGGVDAARLRPRHTLTLPGPADAVALSPDGKRVAASAERQVVLFDAATGAELRRLQAKGKGGTLRGVCFSPDGARVIAAEGDPDGGTTGVLVAWDAATGAVVRRSDETVGEGVSAAYGPRGITRLAFSPDGRWLATAHRDGSVAVRDGATLRPKRILSCGGREVLSVAFSPDGKTLAAGTRDGAVTLWPVK
jgi:WD40 repeat protein